MRSRKTCCEQLTDAKVLPRVITLTEAARQRWGGTVRDLGARQFIRR